MSKNEAGPLFDDVEEVDAVDADDEDGVAEVHPLDGTPFDEEDVVRCLPPIVHILATGTATVAID